ncbi:hypothetical protein ACJO2E_03645 [Marinobacter sp. M1N3S26]|uniref:hypothetical protein n=1 Tax=Marinobacter sp. M1N3S26 TaxID=3382299 RepID=UPI00387AC7FC
MSVSPRLALAGLLALVMLSGCATGQPGEDGRYPGDARECDSLPLYERQECRERHPPLHEPYDLTRPELS